jgi:gamma-butyrobetaine dioxygenase
MSDPLAGLAAVAEAGDEIAVTFSPDGHQAVFRRAWLAGWGQAAPAAGDERTEDAKRLWTAADFPGGPPAWSWPEYLDRPRTRAACLAALLTDGFAVLRGVPREPGAVLEVAGGMGFVRETNYGRLFDVRVTATPSNLAFTGLPISPHTDNPYRDPVPTVQLLHCLDSDVTGGDSGVTDGFAAAGLLRAADPAAFRLLAATPVTGRSSPSGPGRTRRTAPSRTPGRQARPSTGGRHLQGCYADLDGVSSTLALLRRTAHA